MGRRIRWMGLVMILCFALVLVQLVNLQFRRSTELATAAANPRNRLQDLNNLRGSILAADGTVLAYSQKIPNAGRADYQYQRVYPEAAAQLFSDIVGYDSINYGTWGAEYQYNDQLVSHKQPPHSLGQFINPTTSTDDVYLTVQPKLQALAQQELAGRDGSVVVLNPTTGAVLAMYGNPTYDPNLLASPSSAIQTRGRFLMLAKNGHGYSAFDSLPYAERWAPGSTFKVITTAAAYDYAPLLVNKSYPVQSSTKLPQSPLLLHNDGGAVCGGTIAQMLPPSCDQGYALLGLDVGATNMYKQVTQFGYDQVPPLDLPGVIPSNFPTPTQLQNDLPGLAYSSIGQQDVAATTLQGALEAAAIANGGVIMKPHVMAQIRDSQGNVVANYGLQPWMRATTQATAAAITPLMEEVVTSGTAGGVGFLPEDQVAAKTGTAQAGLNNQLVDAWMVAFAPASQPRVAVAVTIPFSAPSITGAEAAGPVVKAMIEAALAMTGPLPPPGPVPHYTGPSPTAPAPASPPGPAPSTTSTAPGATTTTGPGVTTTTLPPVTTTAPTEPVPTTTPTTVAPTTPPTT